MSEAKEWELTSMLGIAELSTELRHALRRLAKAVVIISSSCGGIRYAMAATAVSELSMDPPSMLICVNQSASLQKPLAARASFCINILDRAQQEIAELCSGPIKGEARFDMGDWVNGPHNIPVLRGAQANIVCRNERRIKYGTHFVYIGRVIEILHHGEVDPLIYMDGRYSAAQRVAS